MEIKSCEIVLTNVIFVLTFSYRSSHQRCSIIKGVFGKFAKFTGKHLCQSLLFNKKQTLAQVFSCKFCEIFKKTFFTEHLWTTAYVQKTSAVPLVKPDDLSDYLFYKQEIEFYFPDSLFRKKTLYQTRDPQPNPNLFSLMMSKSVC